MKLLVIGGAGYIGSHTVVELIDAGFEPIIVDDFSNSNEKVIDGIRKITGKEVEVFNLDYKNIPKLSQIIDDKAVEAVIHFAAFKAVGESAEQPLKYYDNNVSGFIKLLQLVKKKQINYFVLSSSAAVYGSPDTDVMTEESPCQPMSVYGWTKYMDEVILKDECSADKELRAVTLRYFNVVGSHSSHLIGELPNGKPENLLPLIVQVASHQLPKLTIFGDDYPTEDGTCLRDYIHVVDLAQAHVAALKKIIESGKPNYRVYNVGTGKPTSVKELLSTFEKVNNIKVNFEIGPRRVGDPVSSYASVKKAESELNWKATKTTEDSSKDAWAWQEHLSKSA